MLTSPTVSKLSNGLKSNPSLASIFNLWKVDTSLSSINVIGCEELASVESTSIKFVLVDKPAVKVGTIDKITIDITNIELNFSDLYKRKDGNYLPFWRFVPSVGEVGGANLVDYDIGNETFLLGDKPEKVRGSLKEKKYIIP